MAAPKNQQKNRINAVTAATGGQVTLGNASSHAVQPSPLGPPTPNQNEPTHGLDKSLIFDQVVAEKKKEEKVSEKKDAGRGLAKASPRFQELKPKAEASEQDKEKSISDNKVDEIDLSEK